jgi:hypothetical protein
MNDRIKELLSQAGVHYEVMPKDTVYEKFAELIVKECAGLVEDYYDEDTKYLAGHIIRKHFGVK